MTSITDKLRSRFRPDRSSTPPTVEDKEDDKKSTHSDVSWISSFFQYSPMLEIVSWNISHQTVEHKIILKDGGSSRETSEEIEEKKVYELQLSQLQEQLVAAMIENQGLGKVAQHCTHLFMHWLILDSLTNIRISINLWMKCFPFYS